MAVTATSDSGATPIDNLGDAVARNPQAVQFLDLKSELTAGQVQAQTIAIGVLVSILLMVATFGLVATGVALTWTVVLILFVVFACLLMALFSRRRLMRWTRELSARYFGAADLFEATVPLLTSGQFGRIWTPLLRQMSQRGDRGVALRIHFGNQSVSNVQPLAVEFEPLPLNCADERLRQLAGGELAMSSGRTGSGSSAPSLAKRLGREARRKPFLLGCWTISLMIGAYSTFRLRQVQWWLVYCVIMILFQIFEPLWSAAVRGDSFLLVPGGLISRRGRGFKPSYQLHLFRAADSLLVLIPLAGRWSYYLRDAEHETGTQIDDSEAEMLLRAWLSPLPPPDDRPLRELAGKSSA